MILGPDNAIAWAQFQLRGGWKSVLVFIGIYCAIIGGLATLMINLTTESVTTVMTGWAAVILGLQAANLLLFAPSRIGAAIRKDVTTPMIESHRLMPASAVEGVVGYITGASAHSIAVGIAHIVIGGLMAVVGHITLERWLIANLILILFAIFIWFFTAFAAFMTKGVGLLWMILVAFWISQGYAALILPGLTLLITPIIGKTIFEMRAEVTWPQAAAVVIQAALVCIFCAGAARRYVRPDRSGLGVVLGLLLLGCWTLASVIGITQWENVRPAFMNMGMRRHSDVTTEAQIVATVIVIMLLALAPLANAARDCAHWALKRDDVDPARPRRPVPPEIVAIVAAILAAVLPIFVMKPHTFGIEETQIGLIVLLCLLAMGYLLRWVYRAVTSGAMIAVLWIVVTWLGPLFVYAILRGTLPMERDDTLDFISSISPIGALAQLGSDPDSRLYRGLAGQAALILIPATLYYTDFRRKKSMAAAASK